MARARSTVLHPTAPPAAIPGDISAGHSDGMERQLTATLARSSSAATFVRGKQLSATFIANLVFLATCAFFQLAKKMFDVLAR